MAVTLELDASAVSAASFAPFFPLPLSAACGVLASLPSFLSLDGSPDFLPGFLADGGGVPLLAEGALAFAPPPAFLCGMQRARTALPLHPGVASYACTPNFHLIKDHRSKMEELVVKMKIT